VEPGGEFAARLDRTRLAARQARSNAEASLARLRAEPGVSEDQVNILNKTLVSSHRLVHALMSLEAGLATSAPVPPREAFRKLTNDADATIYYLAAALRGSSIERGHLPDLREDHHALRQSGDPHVDRYALVNVETDRMVNSLNTLSGHVLYYTQRFATPVTR
jgi:non-ribosomal peptide synthetase component F